MAASTVTSKGQITLPKQIREHLHVVPGDRIDFVVEDNGHVVVRPARSRLEQLRGLLRDRNRTSLADVRRITRRYDSQSVCDDYHSQDAR